MKLSMPWFSSICFLSLQLLSWLSPQNHSLEAQDGKPGAEAIAEEVLKASGGKKTWENTCCLHWKFFGSRELWWDKAKGRVRIEVPKKDLTLIADMREDTGKAWQNGEMITEEQKLQKMLDQAERIWANDSYWLFMPFKMLDEGVELKKLGVDTLSSGPAYKLRMTFEEVGFTPRNKYHVWVDQKEHLVRKWAYFSKRSKSEPDLVTPWKGYQSYNGLKLSGDRGERSLTDISVPDAFPKGTFSKKKLSERSE